MRRVVNVAWTAITEYADEKVMDRIAQAVAAHERHLAGVSLRESGRPYWWDDDADRVAAEWRSAFG